MIAGPVVLSRTEPTTRSIASAAWTGQSSVAAGGGADDVGEQEEPAAMGSH